MIKFCFAFGAALAALFLLPVFAAAAGRGGKAGAGGDFGMRLRPILGFAFGGLRCRVDCMFFLI